MDIKEASFPFGERLKRHPWELARLEVIDKLLRRFASDTYNGGSIILDMGCGDTFVTRELAIRYQESRLIAIDKSLHPLVIQRIRMKAPVPNLEIYQSLDQVPYDTESIEIVLLLDVLEHLENDVLFLGSTLGNRLIKRNATFLITVPAFQCLFSARDRFLNHFRRYKCKQLLEVVQKAEMNAIEYGYFFSSLLLPRLLQVIFERISIIKPKPGTRVAKWRGLGSLDLWLQKALLFDFDISLWFRKFDVFIPGLSCYLIGRK